MRQICLASMALLMASVFIWGCGDDNVVNGDKTPLTLSLTPGSVSSSVDSTFVLVVEAKNVEDLFGVSCEVEYDGTKLEATDVLAGALMGNDVLFFEKKESGLVSVAATKKKGSTGVDGAGELARIGFRSLAPGHSEIVFVDSTLAMRRGDGSNVAKFSGIVLEESSVDIE